MYVSCACSIDASNYLISLHVFQYSLFVLLFQPLVDA